jgi:hypothetical protein
MNGGTAGTAPLYCQIEPRSARRAGWSGAPREAGLRRVAQSREIAALGQPLECVLLDLAHALG